MKPLNNPKITNVRLAMDDTIYNEYYVYAWLKKTDLCITSAKVRAKELIVKDVVKFRL